jgi:hypothetical protein
MTTTKKAHLNAIIPVFITLLIISNAYPPTQAQTTPTTFTPTTKFNIPEQNGTINFAFNGSFTAATLQNGTWTFSDLNIDHPQSFGGFDLTGSQSIGDLKFSTQNSNVTIWAYLTFYYTIPVDSLVYSVEGVGKQTVNLGLNSTKAADPTEWSIIMQDNVFLAEGQGWTLLPDETLVISGATSNVTIAHFELNSFESNLIFYLQHSIALLTTIILAAVITVAIVVKVRFKRKTRIINS